MTFTVAERDAFRKSIVQYQVQNSTKTKAELVAHFQQQGVPRRTIYKISPNWKKKEVQVTVPDLIVQVRKISRPCPRPCSNFGIWHLRAINS